ncbi:MAG TPA: NIPSNAP family protein [Candidatus Acidoferrales bacterium]|nr:NIPSNAP family protein [Candidatus Acidoferrales bacterium]
MKRRTFVTASAAAGLYAEAPADPPSSSFFHLVYFYLRSGPQVDRTTQYLSGVFLPAAQRAGVAPVGFFSPVVGERSPFILSLASFPSLAAMDATHHKFAEDKEFQKGFDAYNNMQDPPYVRMESSLLRAFNGMPSLEVPPNDGKRPAHIFEMRTYESVNDKASARKVKMFEDGEMGIFRRLGMTPVFFGRTMVGRNLPSLTYMLTFDDLASRDKLWRNFGADPEWQKLRGQPGLSDAEIVSNISNAILRPLPFSPIR